MRLTVACCIVLLLCACADEPAQNLGIAGASCTKTPDCESPLQCIAGVCTDISDPKDVQPDRAVVFPEVKTTPDVADTSADTGLEVIPVDLLPGQCASNDDCEAPTPLCALLKKECVECLTKADCPEGLFCKDWACNEKMCNPGEQWCEGGNAITCNDDGTAYASSEACGDKVCVDGECLVCEPGKKDCDGNTVIQCNVQGDKWADVQECTGQLGCVNGLCPECYPGDLECKDGDSWTCKQDGSAWELAEECGGTCMAGKCISPCGNDPKMSNVGCDYWAVDLDNAKETDALGITYDAENQQYAVVVSNISSTSEAKVTIHNSSNQVDQATVAAGSLHTFNLPAMNVVGSVKGMLAYRIQSTIPIVAYQFNPSENKGVFSNDASLLLPVHSLGKEYLVVSKMQDDPNFRGFVTIVGVEPGETTVTVNPTGAVASGNGVPSLAAGSSEEFTLSQYEVLNLETAAMGEDLTGTWILADKRISVFGGSECASSPVTNLCENGTCKSWPQWNCSTMKQCPALCCCDHLEQQMIPVPAWGKHYAVGHSKFRGNEADTWVVLAAEDGTGIQTNPQVATIPTLDGGEHFTFETKSDFELTANKPVLLVQFLSGEQAPDPNPDTCMLGMCMTNLAPCTTAQDCGPSAMPVAGDAGTGDPAMILLPATEQWRTDYMFLVPQNYNGGNFLTLVAPEGATVTLDGNVVAAGTIFGNGDFHASIIQVNAGVHIIQSAHPVSVMVHGYDSYVSYGYSAGMNVQNLQ